MSLNDVNFPYAYVPYFDKGKPIYNGYIYIGEPDLDPEVIANQKTIYFVQEDGTQVVGAQPVRTGAGGVPTYNGSPIKIKVDGDYSIKILNAQSAQAYYSESGNSGNFLQTVATLAELPDAADYNGKTRYVIGVGNFKSDGTLWQPIDRPVTEAMFGIVADSSTDYYDEMQQLIDLSATVPVDIVGVAGEYIGTRQVITIPSFANIKMHNTAHIRNISTATPAGFTGTGAFWSNTFTAGNYAGETNATNGALFAITYYGIAAASAGDTTITFDTPADASNFAVGGIAFLKSAVVFKAKVDNKYIPKFVQLNRVKEVDSGTGVVTFERPLNYDYSSYIPAIAWDEGVTETDIMQARTLSGTTYVPLSVPAVMDATTDPGVPNPAVWRIVTSLGSSAAMDNGEVTGLDGLPVNIVQNVKFECHGKLSCAATGSSLWSIWHHSAYECDFKFNETQAEKHHVGGNPSAYCTVKGIRTSGVTDHTENVVEMTYMSHDTTLEDIQLPIGVLNLSETGGNIKTSGVYVGVGSVATGRKHYVDLSGVTLGVGKTALIGAVILGGECIGSSADSMIVKKTDGTNGIYISPLSVGCSANGAKVMSTDTGYSPILIGTGALGYSVCGASLGLAGAYASNDRIKDDNDGTNGKFSGNTSILNFGEVRSYAFATHTGTTANTVVKTKTLPANSMQKGTALRIRASGNVSGTTNTKSIKIKIGGTAFSTVAYTAGQTGAWNIDMALRCATDGASGQFFISNDSDGAAGAVIVKGYNGPTLDTTATINIELELNIQNVADSIVYSVFEVTAINDQYSNV